jgi:hypothetical protein
MKLGLIGGGFKPFTTGHFTLLASALAENDQVIIYYGLASRKKGSGYNYTREMSEQIFSIMKAAIEREYAGQAHVTLGSPTPIVKIFKVIEAVKDRDDPGGVLSSLGIDPRQVDSISIYSSPEDLRKYERYLGTERESKYYGDMYQTGQLQFVPVDSLGASGQEAISTILSAVRHAYPDVSDEELTDLIQVRGSDFRSLISTRDAAKIGRYLPNLLNDDEKDQIISILIQGLDITESIFRQYVQAVIRSG